MSKSSPLVWAATLAAVVLHGAATAKCVRAQASSEQPQDVRVARLIRDLGAPAYADRERAAEGLARIGADTRRQLEQAATSEDSEIRLHALALLKQLNLNELWAPALVRCRADGALASSVLAGLAEQSGNRVLIGEQYGTFHEGPVHIDYPAVPFWQAVDEICRQTKNQVRHHYDARTPGLVFVAGEPGEFPTAYAGPVRAQVTSARRVFIEELDYEDLKSEITHTFQLNLQVMWEDRFRLVAYRSQPELVEALIADQAPLAAAQAATSAWNVASTGTRQLAMNLRLHPPAVAAGRLDTLRLKWGLIAVGDVQTIDVSELSSTAPHFQDDVELIVESVQERPGARYEVAIAVHRDRIIPQPQEIIFQENEVELFDAEGRSFKKQGQTNSLTDQGAKIRFTFAGETATSAPKLLRFTYPRLRAQQDLEIVFRNVPLPASRPE